MGHVAAESEGQYEAPTESFNYSTINGAVVGVKPAVAQVKKPDFVRRTASRSTE